MLRSCSLALLALHGASALQVAKPAISTRRADGLRSTAILAVSATDEGQASLPSSTANLVKSIVGSGVLSLPVGLAAFSSSRAALVPALALLSVAGTVSGYCFSMVARVCAATDSSSWGEAWSKSARCQSSRAPVGEKSSWVPPALIGLLTLSVSIQYTMVIGDSFSSIFSARRPSSLLAWGLPALLASRTGAIAALTAFGTLPLSLLPSLSALSFTSALGVAGLLYTAAFMVLRMSSYGPGSALHAAAGGFALSAALTAVVMAAGFLTFGGACDGFILNNYAPTDRLAQLARVAIGSQIVFTYPFIHVGLRDSAQALLASVFGKAPARVPTTFGIFALTTAIAISLTNLGLIAAVTGALVSTSIGYVLPSLMLGQTLARRVRAGGASRSDKLELLAARGITALGVALAGIGVWSCFV
ncbi:hypothetical protein EMIHUDRAFT_98651 [Emiliania huxleyi CCMP1516]|uniref:Amino acid transporter transmembrane domain-containing protein n=2 Tax=Emiliania huxleyi TaxID=2903 RepID=A0A0D3KEQ9_EMIH1|nr:hypothetical protein EMIHUDRAFT_98651 [Emiliania huxleyi CCMP1516]EOD34244.1 hypothetical protein EMIHUDRAFT_98651 [Emiliania huxleyi CCMP1516]|eukprot:XP_005786673.1 hypothetical protein EMIHUDRAFT_98651 [Emiliania huxleyi CCMP1516]